MKKLLLAPILLVVSCLIAGSYGAFHDQISYSVSYEYFHAFKFIQFDIPPDYQNRLGAAMVGWMGSWWMGLIIGLPILLIALITPGHQDYARHFLIACVIVVGTTIMLGLGALGYAYVAFSDTNIPGWAQRPTILDQLSFARAGNMHSFSYIGGVAGMLLGSGYSLLSGLRLRRIAKAQA